jgi:hypothetical protein
MYDCEPAEICMFCRLLSVNVVEEFAAVHMQKKRNIVEIWIRV